MTREQEIIAKAENYAGRRDADIYIAGYRAALRDVQRHIKVLAANNEPVLNTRQLMELTSLATCAHCGSIRHHVSDCDER